MTRRSKPAQTAAPNDPFDGRSLCALAGLHGHAIEGRSAERLAQAIRTIAARAEQLEDLELDGIEPPVDYGVMLRAAEVARRSAPPHRS